MRLKRLFRLMRMEGSVGECIGSGAAIIAGFFVGVFITRFLQSII